jgi:hypothetical protein
MKEEVRGPLRHVEQSGDAAGEQTEQRQEATGHDRPDTIGRTRSAGFVLFPLARGMYRSREI